jgi:pimeloyl-ACP methyl ester carboxylesterase
MYYTLRVLISLLVICALVIVTLLLVSAYIQKKIIRRSKKHTSLNGYCYTETVTLGGIDQSILVQAGNKGKPILLVLHGGPGMPVPGVSCRAVENILQVTTSRLIDNFTLIYWDQRGTGKSYSNRIDKNSMNINQFNSDANELVDKLREKFKVEKIYLAGISWGSVIGLNLVKQFPDKFFAYFGLAQIINWAESDKLFYQWAVEYAKSIHSRKAIDELTKIGNPPYNDSAKRWNVLRKWLMKFNGYIYKESLINPPRPMSSSMKQLLTSPDYNIRDVVNTFKGMPLAFGNEMINDISKIDFFKINEIEIPVFFFHGRHDKVCNVNLMERFFDQINAPLGKNMIWLDNSAHFFYSDDAKKVEEIIIESALAVF